jgi:putative glutamine amidotransferase
MSDYYPIIGVPCRPDVSGLYPSRPINAQNQTYINAIIQAGGIPILIPVEITGKLLETVLHQVNGLVFSGGGDIDPIYYNESPMTDNLSDIQKDRDELEFQLIRLAIESHKPFFAICRGIQVMNVAIGGNLWQDLASQCPQAMRHDYYYQDEQLPRNYIAHEVKLEKSSLLSKILETDRLSVNSLHHQAAKEIAPSLRAAGYADDGIVEVLEAPNHPFGLGVQWHPEELVAEQETARKIFAAFIEVSRNGHKY